MTDYFALLGVERSPSIDSELLKANFHRLSHAAHPDHLGAIAPEARDGGGTAFAEISAGYRCLLETKDRLAHLIEIELGHKPLSIQQIPDEIASVGAQVMTVCRSVDAFLGGRQTNSPPMVRAQRFKDSMTWLSKCDALEASVVPLQLRLDQELEWLRVAWNQTDPQSCGHPTEAQAASLDRCYRLASYLTKWTSQIKERRLALSL